jgi:hypothetical protein
MRARKIAEGRWVKTIVYAFVSKDIMGQAGEITLMFPNLFAIEDARSMEIEPMILVTKKMEPSFPSGRWNLSLKNHVNQDLDRFSDHSSEAVE